MTTSEGPAHTAVGTERRWEAVKDLTDRRRVSYWRLREGERRTDSLGAISRKPGGVRALLYDWANGNPAVIELGYHASLARAKKAVEDALDQVAAGTDTTQRS